MSYLSRVTGRIEIRPPLPWSVALDSQCLHSMAVRYDIAETTEDTPTGVVITRTAVAIVASSTDWYSAYDLEEHLAKIGREIVAAGSGCYGYLVRSGEEQGDVERYGFGPDDEVVTERAVLRWEDGSEVEP